MDKQHQQGVFIYSRRNGITRYAFLHETPETNICLISLSPMFSFAEAFEPEKAKVYAHILQKQYPDAKIGLINPEYLLCDVAPHLRKFCETERQKL